jgi:hypothetical protein
MAIPFLRRLRPATRNGAVTGNIVHIPAPPPEGRGGQPMSKSPGLKQTYTAARKSSGINWNSKMSSNGPHLNGDNFDANNQ